MRRCRDGPNGRLRIRGRLRPRRSGSPDVVTATFALGVLAALVSAVLYSAGVTLQAMEAREAPTDESLKLSLLKRLVRRRRWLAGTGCVIGGWGMQAIALTLAPITIVQPTLALSVVSLLIIAVNVFHESLRKRELLAALAIVVGVAGLVAVAPSQTAAHAK